MLNAILSSAGRLFGGGPATPYARSLAPVPVRPIEGEPDQRTKKAKYLIKGNHVHHALVRHAVEASSAADASDASDARYNETAYLVYALYMLGAQVPQMEAAYGLNSGHLADWPSAPVEIARVDWREFLGQPLFQRAYVDFFEDVLAEYSISYKWHTVVEQYLFGVGYEENNQNRDFEDAQEKSASADADTADGNEDHQFDAIVSARRGLFLRDCLIGSLGNAILHLATGFELDSRQLAIGGLALAAATYDAGIVQFLQELRSAPSTKTTTTTQTTVASLKDALAGVRHDKRFDSVRVTPATINSLLAGTLPDSQAREALVHHWRAWDLAGRTDLTPCLAEAQKTFVQLLLDTATHDQSKAHDAAIYQIAVLTHALRVLLPFVPRTEQLNIFEQWWLLALALYLQAGRPAVGATAPGSAQTSILRKWMNTGDHINDTRYNMAVYTMHQASETWPDDAGFYKASAETFMDTFVQWK